jgi:hypothetical protein
VVIELEYLLTVWFHIPLITLEKYVIGLTLKMFMNSIFMYQLITLFLTHTQEN